jgi:hypothetical protein
MTRDEIIEMADKADEEADKVLNMKGEYHPNWHQVRDEIFAKLVAAKEREACALICENFNDYSTDPDDILIDYHAHLIRARNND